MTHHSLNGNSWDICHLVWLIQNTSYENVGLFVKKC